MSDVTTNQVAAPGMVNGTGARDQMFLEVYSGLVLKFFNDATVTQGRVTTRTIPHGKSASFPVSGKGASYYHTPGQELDFTRQEANQKIINIRGLCLASTFTDILEDAQNHWPQQTEYARQNGEALASEMDTLCLQAMVAAARETSNLTSNPGGQGEIITGADAGAIAGDWTILVDALYAAAQKLDEKNIPGNRQFFTRPLQVYSLFRSSGSSPVDTMVNRDFGGNGSIANLEMPRIAGIEIVKTNLLPSDDQTGASSQQSEFDIDYTNTLGVVNTVDAVGVVKLMSMTSESEYDMRRQGYILNSKFAVGVGTLRPECSIEVNDAGATAAAGLSAGGVTEA